MKRSTFFTFVAPSVVSMLILIALPLVAIVYLALHQSFVQTELKEVKTEVPVFGGLTREVVRVVPQPVLDENGNAIEIWQYVGGQNLKNAVEIDGLGAALSANQSFDSPRAFIAGLYKEISDVDFWSALEFTLLYTFVTTPIILILGFALALAVNRTAKNLRGTVIFVTLLPMIVTPVVSSLAVYWLFIDGGVIAATLETLGLGKFYFSRRPVHDPLGYHRLWRLVRDAVLVHYSLCRIANRACRTDRGGDYGWCVALATGTLYGNPASCAVVRGNHADSYHG